MHERVRKEEGEGRNDVILLKSKRVKSNLKKKEKNPHLRTDRVQIPHTQH